MGDMNDDTSRPPVATTCPDCGYETLVASRCEVCFLRAEREIAREHVKWLAGLLRDYSILGQPGREAVEAAADAALDRSERLSLDEVCAQLDIDPADVGRPKDADDG